MEDKKKSTEKQVEQGNITVNNGDKKPDSDKGRRVLNVVFLCVAVGAAVTTLLLTPFGKRLLPNADTTAQSTTTSTAVSTTVTEAHTVTESETDSKSEETTVFVPEPTEPTVDPYKNYSVLINKTKFNYTEEKGVTTLTAKDNENVILTVTPFTDKSYTKLCEETKELHDAISVGDEFTVEALNSAYRSQTGDKDDDIITTVYCVDDGKGGSIEIKYQTPVNAREFENDFNILLSMFTIHS